MAREISPEVRAARSERMKALNAAKREQKGQATSNIEPVVTSTTGIANVVMHTKPVWSIIVTVDWHGLPLLEAQQAYATLQKFYKQAGDILNTRSNTRNSDMFTCYICRTEHERPARYVNNSYRTPEPPHLIRVVECCGEKCARQFEEQLILERRARNIEERAEHGS